MAAANHRETTLQLHMNEEQHIVCYRVITNRLTGEFVTEPAPVYANNWPYQDVADDQPLLRYMDLWKFEDLMTTQSLYFRRADKFEDPLEGTLSIKGVHGTSATDLAFHQRAKIVPSDYEDLAAYRDIAKSVTFVNCWHINNDECPRMWDTYASSPESVLVISSGASLKAALKKPVAMSRVKYVDNNIPRTEFGSRSLFFYKDSEFLFEKEYRLLIDLSDLKESIDPDDPQDFFRKIPVDLQVLIDLVQPHPRASEDTFEKISQLVQQYLPGATRRS